MDTALVALKVFDFALSLVEAGSVAYATLMKRRAEVQAMVDEGRDPTAEEWDQLLTSITLHSKRIQGQDVDDA